MQVPEIPERGNIAMIDSVHFRELDRGFQEMSPAIHALIKWMRSPEKDDSQVADELELNRDQRELFNTFTVTQLRLAGGARATQLKKRYGGFKKSLQDHYCDLHCPTFEQWEAAGAPGVEEYAERVYNGKGIAGVEFSA